MSEEIQQLKEEEQSRATESAQVELDSEANWIPGVVLIILGAAFLVANLWDFHLDNWWALFILIPAVTNFGNAWQTYQANGRFTSGARSATMWGLIFTIISATFLFNWDWGNIWPLFLILAGLGIMWKSRAG